MLERKGIYFQQLRGQAIFWCLFAVMAIAVSLAIPASACANSKYASMVIDADDGTILHARNETAKRYPASLTKLMTLYLTFEALREGKLSMETRMRASSRAAGMPQTNISLRTGDQLTVKQAIEALVVRSANDAAVVLAEHLGKSEQGFARMMTQKAHALGMKDTTFRNASGLPDRLQRSTAKDLVILAVAMQRHFPEYYHFFNNTQFTFKGRTYKSHNRVLAKLPGADGLKTGYINASGFNIITSARRGGRKLVGVVMGGKSSRSRDSHIVDLMERAFVRMPNGHDVRQFVAQATPTPKFRPGSEPVQVAAAVPEKLTVQSLSTEVTPVAYQPQEAALSPAAGQFRPQMEQAAAPANEETPQTQPVSRHWGVQVGAFQHSKEALLAAVKATNLAEPALDQAKIVISNGVKNNGKLLHRARLGNLMEEEARQACQKLKQRDASCFVFRMADSGRNL